MAIVLVLEMDKIVKEIYSQLEKIDIGDWVCQESVDNWGNARKSHYVACVLNEQNKLYDNHKISIATCFDQLTAEFIANSIKNIRYLINFIEDKKYQ